MAAVPPTVKPPSAAIVATILGSSLQRQDAASHTHYGFSAAQCRTIVAGRRWVCTVRARRLTGHLVAFEAVTWRSGVGFDFGKGVEL